MEMWRYLFCTIIIFVIASCDIKNSDDNNDYELNYGGTGVEVIKSNSDGKVAISSEITINDVTDQIGFEFTLLNSDNGNPVSGVEVHYAQIDDQIVLLMNDPESRFTPSFFWGTPKELSDYFGAKSKRKLPAGEDHTIAGPITITAAIFLVGVARAYIGISKGIVKMDNHYRSGYVREGDGYQFYCKSFDEIGDIVSDRVSIGMRGIGLMLSMATFSIPVHDIATTLVVEAGLEINQVVINDLISEAVNVSFMSLDEINEGKKAGVKIYFEDTPSLRNLFAKMEIIANHPECDPYSDAGFRTSGDFALTSSRYTEDSDWDAIVSSVMGPEYRVADWNDLLSYYQDGGDLLKMLDGLGVTERMTFGFLTRNGNRQYSSTRYYLAARHEHQLPGGWLAHQNINNYMVSLGSWWGEYPILAIRK